MEIIKNPKNNDDNSWQDDSESDSAPWTSRSGVRRGLDFGSDRARDSRKVARAVRFRIMALMVLLLAVIFAMKEAGKPERWMWMGFDKVDQAPKEGDFLVQIDATSFEKELETQNVAVAAAQTRLIQAETVLETAKASELEYTQGVYVEALQTIENEIYDADSQIETAKQELEQSIAVHEHSEKLHSKGFITNRQLNADNFAVSKAKIAIKKAGNLLSLAESKKRVLMEVTKKKELTRLKADIRAAKVDLESQQNIQGQYH